MVTRFDMERQATQERIVARLEGIDKALVRIAVSLAQLAYVATEYGIHEGFLSGSDRREDPIILEGGHQV